MRKAPLEGDRVSGQPLLPDFLAPAEASFFLTPRWRVRVFVGEVLVCVIGWVSAEDAAAAIDHVRGYGFTSAVRYEVEPVEE